MNQLYTIISLAPCESDILVNKLIKWLPRKIYKAYLLKKVPAYEKEVYYIGEKGQNIILPLTKSQIQNYEKEYLSKIIKMVYTKYDLSSAYVDKEIQKYIDFPDNKGERCLNYLLFPQIFERLVKEFAIDCKNMKMIIFDSDDRKIEAVLEILLPNLNHLTIVTKRAHYFEHVLEKVYHETGLIIELISYPIHKLIPGNMIIDMSEGGYTNYRYLENNSVVLDMNWNQEKFLYINSRRRDLNIIYGVEVMMKGEVIDNQLATEVLCWNNWKVSQFVYGMNNFDYGLEWEQLVTQYNMELFKLKALNGVQYFQQERKDII